MADTGTIIAIRESKRRGPGRPFVKGDPRRYTGGTKKVGLIVREVCRKELARKVDTSAGKMPALSAIVRKAVIEAIKGDYKWAEFLVQYGYGKPTQLLGSDPENPLLSVTSLSEFAVKMREAEVDTTGKSVKGQT